MTKKRTINPYKLLAVMLSLFSLTTITLRLWPIVSPNEVLGVIIVLALLYILLKYFLRIRNIIFLTFLAIGILISFLNVQNFTTHISHSIRVIVCVIFLLLTAEKSFLKKLKAAFLDMKPVIKYIIILCNIILLISFFDPNAYQYHWGDNLYYIGYSTGQHIVSQGSILLLSITLFFQTQKKFKLIDMLYFALPSIAILGSGARTFLVSLVIIFIIYYLIAIKRINLKIILPPIMIMLISYLFINSNMIDKFNFTTEIGGTSFSNYLSQITSGRTDFWQIDLNAFSEVNIFRKIFGSGFDFAYLVNLEEYGMAIWPHNDLISILLGVGILGMILYLTILIFHFYYISRYVNKFLVLMGIIAYILFPMLFNGFYLSQHYIYSYIIIIISTIGANNYFDVSIKENKDKKLLKL